MFFLLATAAYPYCIFTFGTFTFVKITFSIYRKPSTIGVFNDCISISNFDLKNRFIVVFYQNTPSLYLNMFYLIANEYMIIGRQLQYFIKLIFHKCYVIKKIPTSRPNCIPLTIVNFIPIKIRIL